MPVTEQATVYIVDDDDGVREALFWSLRQAGFSVQAFPSGESFLQSPRSEGPACLVLDLRMQGMDGLELQQALAQGGAQIPIIFISGYGDIPTSVQAMKAGALDFVEKPLSIEALIARIREALAEDKSRRRQYALNQEVCARYRSLTAREREVMSMVIAGRSNKEIARSLEISRRTVENHRARVMATMQAENVAQLCQMAALCP